MGARAEESPVVGEQLLALTVGQVAEHVALAPWSVRGADPGRRGVPVDPIPPAGAPPLNMEEPDEPRQDLAEPPWDVGLEECR